MRAGEEGDADTSMASLAYKLRIDAVGEFRLASLDVDGKADPNFVVSQPV